MAACLRCGYHTCQCGNVSLGYGYGPGGWSASATVLGTFHYGGAVPPPPRTTRARFTDPNPQPTEPVQLEEVDLDRAPDLIGEIIGWRSWQVTETGDLLAGNAHSAWHKGPNKAICTSGRHTDVPAVGCSCGFYGWHDTGGLATNYGSIAGAFRAWGEIVVHDCGIRAEWAEIVVLLDEQGVADDPIIREALERHYAVPIVKTKDEAEKIAYQFGEEAPKELRPKLDAPAPTAQGVSQAFVALGKAANQSRVQTQKTANALAALADEVEKLERQNSRTEFWTTTAVMMAGIVLLSLVGQFVRAAGAPLWTIIPQFILAGLWGWTVSGITRTLWRVRPFHAFGRYCDWTCELPVVPGLTLLMLPCLVLPAVLIAAGLGIAAVV